MTTAQEVIAEVRRRAWGDLEILEEGVRPEENSWYVPVFSASGEADLSHYYRQLALMEQDIHETTAGRLHVLFVPVTADALSAQLTQ